MLACCMGIRLRLLPPEHWHCRSVLPSRTFRRGQLFQCRCVQKVCENRKRFYTVRCRIAGSVADDFSIWLFYPVNAVSAEFCSRSNAVCSRGGTDSRDVRGEAFQCRNNFVCSGICCDDDFGYCLGITYFEKDSKKMKKALDKFKIVW